MSSPSSSALNGLSLLLSAVAAAASLTLVVRDRNAEPPAVPEEIEDLAEDVQSIRLELRGQIDRLEAMAQRLSKAATTPSRAAEYDPQADLAKMTASQLIERWTHVAEVLTRYRSDPLQREPVEAERGRIEERLRTSGDDAVAEVERVFDSLTDTWMQTRVLTHLIQPIGTNRAYEFAKRVFENPTYLAGVRLYAAQIAMTRDQEGVVGRLIDLLEHPDPTFDRRDEIVNFLKNNPDPRAAKVLVSIAKDPVTETMMRNFAIQALGSYPQPEALQALRELAEMSSLGALRIEAMRSLHKQIGKDILEFSKTIREKTAPEDTSMRQFLDNLDLQYQSSNSK